MKVALLADIHANGAALEKVLLAARNSGAERLLVAGDLVGYYYDAALVLDLLDQWHWDAIGGNHEAMLGDWRAGERHDEIHARYGSSLAMACEQLDAGRLDMLTKLPSRRELTIDGHAVLLCHGAPWDRDHYLYPDCAEAEKARLWQEEADLIIFGHTHYPVLWRKGARIAVNPGSVGQPRDWRPGANWALWDTENGEIAHHRESYDIDALVGRCRRIDPHRPQLQTVLTRSR